MKFFFLYLSLACFWATSVTAQIKVVDDSGNIITAAITVNGTANNVLNEPVSKHIKVKNTGANPVNVKVKFVRVSVAPGHQNNYFCWAQNCYQSATLDSPTGQDLNGQATTSYSDACIVYVSGTTTQTAPQYGGTTSFDYTFYETGNATNNSVTIRVNFVITGPNAIEYGVNGMRFTPAFPNPARGKFYIKAEGLTQDHDNKANIELTNLQGKRVAVLPLNKQEGDNIRLDLPALPAGIYLYQFVVKGSRSRVGKLIVE